ncbi:MAG: SprB repeat-containing protein, partial [Flavobacteriales bacterium]|nr:SprB repeat-containing protein [Flavobacteriales bacterium]
MSRIADSNESFYASIWYEGQSTYNQWLAQGGEAKNENLGDETQWTFYSLSQSITSILVGSGDLDGEVLYIEAQDNNYGLQIGDGANALNGNDNGISMWFDYSGTDSGHGDINGTIDCEIDIVSPEVPGFELDCDDALKVTISGVGMDNTSCATLDINQNPGSVEYIVLETVWKGGTPPAVVTFTADGTNYVANAEEVLEGNGSNQNNKAAYRVQVPASEEVGVCVPSGYNQNLLALTAYEFRSGTGSSSAGSAEYVGRHLYLSSYTMNLTIPEADETRDVIVTLPLTDMSDDGRNADIQITAGPVSKTFILSGNTNGLALNLTPLIVEDVPGDVTEVSIDLISNPNNNPSSFMAAGLVVVDAQCDDRVVIKECEILGYNGAGERHFWFEDDFGQDWISDDNGLLFTEYSDGTATITGEMFRSSDSDERFDVFLSFNNKSDYDQFTVNGFAPKECGASQDEQEEWTYYEVDHGAPNVLVGQGDLEGEFLYIRNRDGMNFGLQIGENRANCKNDSFGFSIWFSYSGTAHGHGDINASLNCECSEVLDINVQTTVNTVCTGENPDNNNCDCQGGLSSVTFEYTGGSGITGGAYDYHDNTLGQWTLQNGGVYTFDFSNANHSQWHEHNDPQFWTYENGDWVHHGTGDSSCSTNIIGNSYGPFTVIGYTDLQGNACGSQDGGPSCNGSATATVTSGTPPYTYQWSTGANGAQVDDLCSGNYTLTVTDANGCENSVEFTVGDDTDSPEATISSTPNTVCDGTPELPPLDENCDCDGRMRDLTVVFNGNSGSTVTVRDDDDNGLLIETFNNVQTGDVLYVGAEGLDDGEFETWTYFYVNGGSEAGFHTSCSQDILGLTTGDFTVIGYTDGAGQACGGQDLPPSCNGTATVNVTSGVAPYSYHWSSGDTEATAEGLCAGDYTVIVTDANGCSTVLDVSVENDFADLDINVQTTVNTVCIGENPDNNNCDCQGGLSSVTFEYTGG